MARLLLEAKGLSTELDFVILILISDMGRLLASNGLSDSGRNELANGFWLAMFAIQQGGVDT